MIRIKNWIQSSLSRIFISILLFLYLITIIAAVYAFIGSSGKISKNYINRFVKAQNQLEKNKLIALLERELTLSQKLADDPAIIKWIQNENNSSQMLLAEEQLTSYHKLIETSSQFIAIKSSNHFYLGNIRTPGKVLVEGTSADRWFYEALNAEKDYSLNVNYDNLLNKVMVWINVLVRDKDGNAIAVAGSGIDLSGFLEKLLLHDEKGVSTVIINSLGQIQAHPDRSIVEHNGRAKQDSDKIKIYDLLKNPKDHELIKQAIASLNDNAQPVQLRLNIHDKKSIVAIGHIPHIDWYNMVIVDEDSLIGVKDFVPLGMVFLISLILMLISILFIFSKMITLPLSRLSQGAKTVASGSYDTSLPEDSFNEIGQLSKSFNLMTTEIKRYINNLEQLVEDRTYELKLSNQQLNETQTRLIDSIEYAKLIQHSFLPSERELAKCFSEYFIINKPLEIVGGDFYYFRENAESYYIACIDCTGHGVPGAFMTIMVNTLLNQILDSYPKENTGFILQRLHEIVRETLKSQSEHRHLENGLDIALCKISKDKQSIQFSGGGLPLIISHEGTLKEIKGDSFHLGFSNYKDCHISEHHIKISSGDCFYMITDGILDLPGGKQGYGLGHKGWLDMIQTAGSAKPDKEIILEAIKNYQEDYKRKDDLLIISFRL